jgi:hypothetical protein
MGYTARIINFFKRAFIEELKAVGEKEIPALEEVKEIIEDLDKVFKVARGERKLFTEEAKSVAYLHYIAKGLHNQYQKTATQRLLTGALNLRSNSIAKANCFRQIRYISMLILHEAKACREYDKKIIEIVQEKDPRKRTELLKYIEEAVTRMAEIKAQEDDIEKKMGIICNNTKDMIKIIGNLRGLLDNIRTLKPALTKVIENTFNEIVTILRTELRDIPLINERIKVMINEVEKRETVFIGLINRYKPAA